MRTEALVMVRRVFGMVARRAWVVGALLLLSTAAAAPAQQKSGGAEDEHYPKQLVPGADRGPASDADAPAAAPGGAAPFGGFSVPDVTKRENFSAALQLVVLLTVL